MKHEFFKKTFSAYSPDQLAAWLRPLGFSLDNPQPIAKAILALSDIYTSNRGSSAVWEDPRFLAAYLCYFMPLNLMRCEAALLQTRHLPKTSYLIDYGAGLGALSLAALNSHSFEKIILYEPSKKALKMAEDIFADLRPSAPVQFESSSSRIDQFLNSSASKTVGYSYSLNEFQEFKENPQQVEQFLFVEPSTQKSGRALQTLREQLLEKKHFAWAPCLHQEKCPLLHHSKTDWCHTRLHVAMPDWFLNIEKFLPIKNQSLTFSYLATSTTSPLSYKDRRFRLVGDTLFEKGKVKQAVCRSDRREFLSWLKKDGEPPLLSRGEIIVVDSEILVKGDELRAVPEFSFRYLDQKS